jgi:hypothetical protein
MRARPRARTAPVVRLAPLPFWSLDRDRPDVGRVDVGQVDGECGHVARQPYSARIIARFSG